MPSPRGHARRGRLMPTHQSIGGATDEQLLQRMVATHSERFGEDFWAFFTASVAPHLPPSPAILDLGCGPALFLRDLGERYPTAALYGYDVTAAMVAHGRALACMGAKPNVALLDAATEALPHAAGSTHLVSMSSVLHVIDEPLPVLAEIRRVLRPGGIFLLNDWIRQPLADYLAWRREVRGEEEDEAECLRRGFRLFPVHSKYTSEDWLWLLGQAGFAVRHRRRMRTAHEIFVAVVEASR